MKLLILALCFCLAVAENSKLIDELEKLLSSDSASDSQAPDIGILEKVDELDALMQDTKESEPMASEKKPAAKYGYCLDGSTFADGPDMRGCARKLCYDERPGECIRDFKNKNEKEKKIACYKDYSHYRERCPFTCGFCKQRSPGLECRRKYGAGAKYGCCWDGLPAFKPDKSDCMVCRDINPHTCRQFYNDMKGEACGTNSYRIRQFLFSRCPRLCGRCQ
ncbi:uncharacterized protein LOC116287301 [Actinia tenebrosa]|uniref:Uncharacterized protein LOC116287301 n=1 Tax=Actinia tenebrosa TaxID=6105 RepID=A0A6P8H2K3_ACTTE|nr:uncharacterized protein LOC116287301 [Actinia tenebrosa]